MRMRTLTALGACLLLYSGAAGAAPTHLLSWQGPITPVAAEYLTDGVSSALDAGAVLVVVRLDTPGGLDSSMRDIVKAVLASPVPVAVWVGPAGSRAASAGAIITVASHVAAMSPGTNIGSASPVQISGAGMDSTMARKVNNDAAAYAASLAGRRDRNTEIARRFVTEALNLTAREALTEGVIDLVVADVPALLDSLRGRVFVAAGDSVVVPDEPLVTVVRDLSARQKLLKALADPNLAYILMMLGIYGLFFELSNPGAFAPGVLGGICLLLALFAFQALPVDYSGAALILLGVVLLILEVKVTSHGVLSVGGIAALVLGSLMLFDSPEPWARVSLRVLVPTVGVFAAFFLGCVWLAVRGYRKPVVTGKEALVGEAGRILHPVKKGEPGKVAVHGEIWNATSDEDLPLDTAVTVAEVEGRALRVAALGTETSEPGS